MPLKKAMDFKNGVITDAAYIEISNANLDFANKTANFQVKTFLTKEVKNQGLGTIIPDRSYYVNSGAFPTIPPVVAVADQVDSFTKYFSSGDLKTNCETYLKTLDEYKDCTIVE